MSTQSLRNILTANRLAMAALLAALCVPSSAMAQRKKADEPEARLRSIHFKDGDEMLHAFVPISSKLRRSIVKLDVNGATTALATVVDTNGLALTKASELKKGKLTCWLAGGREVAAEVLAADEESDLALVRIDARDLKPIEWESKDVVVGEWTVTPGIEESPQAVGIVSVPPRKILPKRAYIGVTLDNDPESAKIMGLSRGMGAEKAGVKTNDVILAVNGKAIKGREELVEELKTFREGQMVKLRVKREGKELDLEVVLKSEEEMFGRRMFDRQSFMNRMGGDVSRRAEDFGQVIQHDTVLEPWLCGGPLVNLDQKVVGINIARAGRVASYALPADLARQALARLRVEAAKKSD
jgi:serine protease Do